MKKIGGILLVASNLLLAGCCTTKQASRWEYQTLRGANDAKLNEMAQQGWIVVNLAESAAPDHFERSFLLKRLKR